jgi:hypothetical protein
MKTLKTLAVLFFFVFTLAACGGGGGNDDGDGGGGGNDYSGGYTGETGDASIGFGNIGDLTVAAASGIKIWLEQEESSYLFTPSMPSSGRGIAPLRPAGIGSDLSRIAARNEAREPVGCSGGGTMQYVDLGTTTEIAWFKMIYDGCVESIPDYGNITRTGEIEHKTDTDSGDFTVIISNLSISSADGNGYIDYFEVSCTNVSTSISCTMAAPGLDGDLYKVEIEGFLDQFEGTVLSGSLVVYDPDHGRVEVTITNDYGPMIFGDCPSGVPGSGTLTLTDADGSTAEVQFNDCDSFTVMVDGDSGTYYWADLL